MKREFSAGGIVYKKEDSQILWLIRRPKGGDDYRGNLGWSFPKGLIDRDETLEQAALREVEEEGGVKAKIMVKLPPLKIFFINPDGQKVMKFISYFAMEWLEDLKKGFGWETEEIKWVNAEEALGLLTYKNEQELLKQAARALTYI